MIRKRQRLINRYEADLRLSSIRILTLIGSSWSVLRPLTPRTKSWTS
jgi:hypothetical protein